jgi:hypothetical protein
MAESLWLSGNGTYEFLSRLRLEIGGGASVMVDTLFGKPEAYRHVRRQSRTSVDLSRLLRARCLRSRQMIIRSLQEKPSSHEKEFSQSEN